VLVEQRALERLSLVMLLQRYVLAYGIVLLKLIAVISAVPPLLLLLLPVPPA
jgi:hypothetical protein